MGGGKAGSSDFILDSFLSLTFRFFSSFLYFHFHFISSHLISLFLSTVCYRLLHYFIFLLYPSSLSLSRVWVDTLLVASFEDLIVC